MRAGAMKQLLCSALMAALAPLCLSAPVSAAPYLFSNLAANNQMATLSRPDGPGVLETESADDFVTTATTTLTSASFIGLLTGANPLVSELTVEIYRVFPADSQNPPSGQVPTRVNSPSDVEFVDRDAASNNLSFTTTLLSNAFTASNSVVNGINPSPNQTTGGEGAVTGAEVQFNITFTTPIVLPADHYFFVPQVQVSGGNFLWLSAARPIVPPGTPFAPDLQAWIRNENLAPDWLRVGTDIVGGATPPTFNMAFSLNGTVADTAVPEPASLTLLGAGLLVARRRFGRRRR